MQNPKPLAIMIITLAGVFTWWTQYYVDYEVSLLPWLVGRGWSLYRDMVDQHTPLLTWLLSFLGGDTGWPLHTVIVTLDVVTLSLVYFVAGRLAGAWAGLVAVALAALWLVAFSGTHLWFDGVLGPVYLGVAACAECGGRSVRDGVRRGKIAPDMWVFGVGLLLGVGVLVKQHAALAVPFALIWAWSLGEPRRPGRAAWFGLGLAIPVMLGTGVLALQGVLGDAWYWTVLYSLTTDYARASMLAPVMSEWPVLAAVYALGAVALPALYMGRNEIFRYRLPILLAGLLIAATVPAWPRYSRFHLQGAVSLLAVAGGVGVVWLWRRAIQARVRGRSWVVSGAISGIALVVLSGLLGAQQGVQALFTYNQFGLPQAPYAATIGPLREWVDANTEPGAPIFAYDLDSIIYRVLEREPTRPFVPQLLWVLSARDSEQLLWDGVRREQPTVVLAPAEWWAGNAPGREGMEGMLRRDYHEGGRFGLVSYPGARRVDVVGLLRNATTGR